MHGRRLARKRALAGAVCLAALACLLGALALPSLPAMADEGREVLRLDIDEVVALGLERNAGLKAAGAGLEASIWARRASYLAFLPTGASAAP